jgi:hypothetical protein
MPVNPSAAIWKQAVAFQDSSMQQGVPSLMTDMLRQMMVRTDRAWWRKHMACMYHCHFTVSLEIQNTGFILEIMQVCI